MKFGWKRTVGIILCAVFAVLSFAALAACGKQDDTDNSGEGSEYTVTFDSMGGREVLPITVDAGTYAEKPDNPTREGHVFKGWYLDLENTECGAFLFDETPITSDITLYALWQIRTFSVRFLDENGEELKGMPSGVYDWGSIVPKPDDSSLQKDGYILKWYKDNGDIWDFENSKVTSNVNLSYRYVTIKDTYTASDIAECFYPTFDKIITDPEKCQEHFTEGDETVRYTYAATNLQQIVVNLELNTLNYSSVSIVARAADKDGIYSPTGTFSQLRAYIKTDLGGNISYNDEPTSGYPPVNYYIQSTGVNSHLFSSVTEGVWTTFTFDLSGLAYWYEGTRLDAFAFGFVSTDLGIEIKSLVFNKVDPEQTYSVRFVDSLGNDLSQVQTQNVKWNTSAVKPEALEDEAGRKYTGNWLDEEGKIFDFTTRIRKNIVLTPEYIIEGVSSWVGEDIAKDFYPVFNNSRSLPADKTVYNGNTVFTYNNGMGSSALEQISVNNLNLSVAESRYLVIRLRLVDYNGFIYNATDVLGRVRIYIVTDLGGDLIVKDAEDAASYYYELTNLNYYAKTQPVDVSAKFEGGWYEVTVDLQAFPYYANGTWLKGFAFGTTTAVKGLEVSSISLSAALPVQDDVTVTFTDEAGAPIAGYEEISVPYGKAVTAPDASDLPDKEGFTIEKWLDADGNDFVFGVALTEDVLLHPVYVESEWIGTDISYTGQNIVDNFTASRERYGNTIGTGVNVQYGISLVEGEASFTYTTDMKAANKCITGLDLGIRIHEGSKLVIAFESAALNAGTHGFYAFKIGLAFRGEDPATTILSTAANAHYFQYTGISTTAPSGQNSDGSISFVIEDGVVMVTFDLYKMSVASSEKFGENVNGSYLEAFTFLAVEATHENPTSAAQNEDTFVFNSIDFISVQQSQLSDGQDN